MIESAPTSPAPTCMDTPDLITLFVSPLERAGINYMISGSVASAVFGEPRATFDVDLAVVLDPPQIPQLAAAFPESEYYLPPPDVIAIEVGRPVEGHFNVIHHDTGLKADLYPSRTHPYFDWAWQHRRTIGTPTGPAVFCPPEYLILRKLAFLREGGGEKHLRDIAGILVQQQHQLDTATLAEAVTRLRLDPEWHTAQLAAANR